MSKQKSEPNGPEKNYRLGNVSATIWCNESSDPKSSGVFRTVQLEQSYQDSNSGDWKSSNRFSLDQLLRLQVCIEKAIGHITDQEVEG